MTSPLRPAVRAAFVAFTHPLEGTISTMYLDTAKPRPLVTIGLGCLIDPVTLALPLPFVRRDTGAPATQDEIRVEFGRIKAMRSLSVAGWREAQKFCELRLTPEGISKLAMQRLDATVADLARRYPAFASWCADAQLGVVSMAWALGSGFEGTHPKCAAALRRGDWPTVVAECGIRNNAPRSAAQRKLFEAAARVVSEGLDPSVLTGWQ